ncbi:hypothetical protein TOK_6204 [Pseudonocardia sp. N23]|nr:hypothetical protein TOK_6204 [Pseudonocardia sp. N23]
MVPARDLARVGQAVLDGRVPPEFLARSGMPGEPAFTQDGATSATATAGGSCRGLVGMGDQGQVMVVSRSCGTVVVRMGDDDGPNVALALRLQQLGQRMVEPGPLGYRDHADGSRRSPGSVARQEGTRCESGTAPQR